MRLTRVDADSGAMIQREILWQNASGQRSFDSAEWPLKLSSCTGVTNDTIIAYVFEKFSTNSKKISSSGIDKILN